MISYDDYVGTVVHVSLVKSFHQSTNSLIHSGQGLPDLKEKIIRDDILAKFWVHLFTVIPSKYLAYC